MMHLEVGFGLDGEDDSKSTYRYYEEILNELKAQDHICVKIKSYKTFVSPTSRIQAELPSDATLYFESESCFTAYSLKYHDHYIGKQVINAVIKGNQDGPFEKKFERNDEGTMSNY